MSSGMRALAASAAAGALLFAYSGAANAQGASGKERAAGPKAPSHTAKNKAAAPAKVPAAPANVPIYATVNKDPPRLVAPAWSGLYAGVSFGPGFFRANTSTVFHSVNNQTIVQSPGAVQSTKTTQDTVSGSSGGNWGAVSDIYFGYNFRPGGNLVAGVQLEGTSPTSTRSSTALRRASSTQRG
jgi:hypothetical protein